MSSWLVMPTTIRIALGKYGWTGCDGAAPLNQPAM
jgi:hypothetical protein